MTKRATGVPVVCAACTAPFTLAPHAYARRCERYGDRILCVRCLTEGWLRTGAGQYHQERALRDEAARAVE